MTRRLYHTDAALRRFDARVVGHARWGDADGVVLDETAFYPEAGGQLGDHGVLAGCAVVDTQEDATGMIVHVLAAGAALPAIGAAVTAELDWARRRQHMAQHTAQHLLSGALLDRARAATASARLGESSLTIDVQRDRIPDAELAAAEDLANDLIDDDLAIRAWFPPPDELATLALRRDPKVDADIRVIAIGDFDMSPCGGTHCARTSQLGAVRIVATERYKGMTRVTFTAARRGRLELFSRDAVLRGLAAQLSCAPADVPGALEQLRRASAAATAEAVGLRGQLASAIAERLVAAAGDAGAAVVAELPDADGELLRAVAARVVAAGRDALVAAPGREATPVLLFRAPGSTRDCGALWKLLVARAGGGRGGGKAERAEGKLGVLTEPWAAMVAAVAD